MDINKTDIIVVLDRSGSMGKIAKDMVGGFLTFTVAQQKTPGECRLSLYQFDTHYEVVYEGKPIADVPLLELVPRGSTALLDAVGQTIAATGERLNKLPEDQRPGAVVFLIITDGQENSSKEYTYEKVQAMIEHQKTQYSWQFAYLGSDLSTSHEASRIGTQSLNYAATPRGVQEVYQVIGESVSDYRNAVRGNVVGAALKLNKKDDDGPKNPPSTPAA